MPIQRTLQKKKSMVPCSCFPVASQWYSGSADRGSGSLGLANSFEIPVGWYWAMGKTCSRTVWRNPIFIAFPRSVALWILLGVVCPSLTTVLFTRLLGALFFLTTSGRPTVVWVHGRWTSWWYSTNEDPGTRRMQLQWEEPPSQSERSHTLKFWVTLMRK